MSYEEEDTFHVLRWAIPMTRDDTYHSLSWRLQTRMQPTNAHT
jgi:hypothetical protein